nr:RVT_2 domain-containing protein [Tanacetum cinerariifolium]
MVDNILFTKKSKSHLIIVQVYVTDIIFGSTCQNLCDAVAKIMHDEFEMSMMGELKFFLGLQKKQMKDKIFFNQSKYIKEMLKKFGLKDSKPTKMPMSMEIKLIKDDEADSLDSTKYRVDVVFDGAFGGVGDEEVVVGEGVVVTSSSLDMLTNNCLGGIMVSLIFLEGLDEEALVEFIIE